MLRYWLVLWVSFSFFSGANAQSINEIKNRAVYNKIEFFYNAQLYDSIYNLASPQFKEQISAAQLTSIFSQLQSLGRIDEATLELFQNNIADYKLSLGEKSLSLQLSIDSSMHYTRLTLKPYVTKTIAKEEKQVPIISKSAKDKPLDFFIDSIAQDFVRQKHAQSLAIGILHRNQSNSYFFGSLEKGIDTLADENTIFEIASLTKIFTATLLADLVDRQIISLEDSISKFLPDSVAANPAIQKITFKTLANHTSGLPRLPANLASAPGYKANDPYAHYDQKALFSFLKDFVQIREPEAEYEYSNVGYGLLGELIAIITKKTFQKSLEDVITGPLEMSNTIEKINPKVHSLIKVYNKDGEEVPQWSFQALAATGAIKSSVKDLLSFAKTHFEMPETDLQKAMALTRQFTFFNPPSTDIGLAWHMNMLEDGVIYYHHAGATYGSSSFIALAPDDKTAVVILSNSALDVSRIGIEILYRALITK